MKTWALALCALVAFPATAALAGDNAKFTHFEFPSKLEPGQRVTVKVRVKNTGKDAWTHPDVKLGAKDDGAGQAARFLEKAGGDPVRVWLDANETVPRGAEREFQFDIVAPDQEGVYVPAFRMVREGVHWFGKTVRKIVVVCRAGGGNTPAPPPPSAPQADDAKLVSASIPASMDADQRGTFEVVVQNTGTATWDDSWRLGVVGDGNGDGARFLERLPGESNRVHLPSGTTVAPGASFKFTFNVIAPTTVRTYRIELQMVHEGIAWFGEVARQDVVVNPPPPPPPLPPKRKGRVRISGRSLEDDGGKFNALGATLFWGAWGYKNDRARLEKTLQFLAENGFDYIRCLGVVGDPNGPDSWDGREIVWTDPEYRQQIAGFTDLAYDTYGLRIEWTLIGDGQVAIPRRDDRFRLVDMFLEMSRGREEKIIHFEIANEYFKNGFGGSDGLEQLRELTRYMNDRTDILVAASSPGGDYEEVYKGGIADLATIHFDRDTSKTEGSWRPVRQPWGYAEAHDVPAVGSNNEPIGPGSSVASERDPVKLVAAPIVTHVAGLPLYVFHSRAGVRGDLNMWDMEGVTSFVPMKRIVPGDLASWTRKNGHWPDSPFKCYARANGQTYPDSMWPDHGGGAEGAVRVYSGVNGDQFFTVPIGVQGGLLLEPRRDVELDVIDPMTGNTIDRKTLRAGEQFELRGLALYVLKGRFR